MKKIVIAIGNLNTGGGQSVVCKLVENIDMHKYEVEVVCLGAKNNTAIEKKVEAVAKVVYLNINGGFSLKSYLIVDKCLKQIKPDVIHAHLGAVQYVTAWSIIHKKKIVVTAHTIPEKAFSKNTERLVRYALKKQLLILVAVSKENENKCRAYFGLNANSCVFVNNGVDIHGLNKKEHGRKFTFINVATQNDNKNQRFLINCFSEVVKSYDACQLLLVGDGPEHNALIKQAKDLSLEEKIGFSGEVSDPTEYYKESDVYLQSSHREAMPMSILEAMGFGLPVISTDVGGIKDVVNGNGIMINDNDTESYTNAMISMINMSEDELDQLKRKSLEIVEGYSAKKMALEYEKIYESTF